MDVKRALYSRSGVVTDSQNAGICRTEHTRSLTGPVRRKTHTHTDKPFAKESAETKHANALTGQTENNKHNAPTGPVAKKNTHPLAGSADEKKTHTHTHT